ncbi:MAG: hypothetical protein J6K89_01340 [Oscillospiraceae bacterium]|nr:hypothetical protein [Oscillospiraceae bacterium]
MIPLLQRKPLPLQTAQELLSQCSDGFHAFYGAATAPELWSRSLSALANTNGGELYLGLEENDKGTLSPALFSSVQEAEAVLPILQELLPLRHLYSVSLYEWYEGGWILHVVVCRTASPLCAGDGAAYIRSGDRDLPCDTAEKLHALRSEKGLCSYEDELTEFVLEDLRGSYALQEVLDTTAYGHSAYDYLRSQCLMNPYTQLRVAAVLLFADQPQAMLPHRCGIRILRYFSDEQKEQRDDFPEEQSLYVEGPLSELIDRTLDAVSQILSTAEIVGPKGTDTLQYPVEALRELITNAVLHRDYSIAREIQIRIFTNRIEIESPGSLLSPVEQAHRGSEQRVRNPKLVRLLSQIAPCPSLDLGKGLRRAFRAMRNAGLQSPSVRQGENSVIVTLGHERLADAQSLVLEYLKKYDAINNATGREITGITDANKMKQVFIQLKDKGLLEIVPGTRSTSTLWRRIPDASVEEIDQISLF